jgi:Flp pilus assembly protein TadD
MDRSLIGVAFVAAVLSTGAWAAHALAQPAASETSGPALDESHFLQAAAQAVQDGDMDGAIQLYHSAIIYAPGDPVPYERLAEFYVHSGQAELAHQFFALALDVQPAYAPALQGLALLDLAAGNRASAQAQHDVLLHSCGATCPETAQVEKALNTATKP